MISRFICTFVKCSDRSVVPKKKNSLKYYQWCKSLRYSSYPSRRLQSPVSITEFVFRSQIGETYYRSKQCQNVFLNCFGQCVCFTSTINCLSTPSHLVLNARRRVNMKLTCRARNIHQKPERQMIVMVCDLATNWRFGGFGNFRHRNGNMSHKLTGRMSWE